ncbi:OmpA family protein [Vibrio renipiscarius]|uniref:Membrane protein n=1 Tax=Vibrio renipiscarius TaxID=1461322 RepID=A0A0C2JN06_9VIBR|nr:OmpA family protein [Vibrio renipiscarius]KII79459.1 membrane protein [Vibrio renipiscarius]KII80912.1 membrane protein [Vibrio renipiscarius]
MKKRLLVTVSSLALVMSPFVFAEEDEYEYIPTPTANQIGDLTDDDRDGVVNARDRCPFTPEGSLITNDGCGEILLEEEQRQLRILFENDSYQISPIFTGQIQTMADFLIKYQSASIEIQGYASRVGSHQYNLTLSKERADAVRDKLLSYQISPDRVSIVGYGDTILAANGNDELSHALNRRVTATVVGLSEEVVEEWNIFSIIEK